MSERRRCIEMKKKEKIITSRRSVWHEFFWFLDVFTKKRYRKATFSCIAGIIFGLAVGTRIGRVDFPFTILMILLFFICSIITYNEFKKY